jgi:hypothetical protein
LRHGFLLFGDFARLDRKPELAARLVGRGDERIDLVADAETFGTLIVAVAREVRAADIGACATFQRDSTRFLPSATVTVTASPFFAQTFSPSGRP